MSEWRPIPIEADALPDLTGKEPWLRIGASAFLLREVVAIVAEDDMRGRSTKPA